MSLSSVSFCLSLPPFYQVDGPRPDGEGACRGAKDGMTPAMMTTTTTAKAAATEAGGATATATAAAGAATAAAGAGAGTAAGGAGAGAGIATGEWTLPHFS